jgi:hypothetical protein
MSTPERHDDGGQPAERVAACAVFADRLLAAGRVWAIADQDGPLRAKGVDGSAAQPFWSSRARVERMIERAQAPDNLKPIEMSLDEFFRGALPALAGDGVLVGIDWEPNESGWVLEADEVRDQIRTVLHARCN